MSVAFSDAERATLTRIADTLVPAAHGMPAASEVGVGHAQLDLVLAARPDLAEPLHRGVGRVGNVPPGVWELLQAEDPEAHAAIVLAILGGYYMHPEVRRRLGYPGQVPLPVRHDKPPEWEREGLLEPVRGRGPIYRKA